MERPLYSATRVLSQAGRSLGAGPGGKRMVEVVAASIQVHATRNSEGQVPRLTSLRVGLQLCRSENTVEPEVTLQRPPLITGAAEIARLDFGAQAQSAEHVVDW